jgi:hypothetical protein
MELDIESELKKLENSLRDFIEFTLHARYGTSWISVLKVSPNRVQHWKDRKDIEQKRLTSSALESRLLYYADFYDLKSIVSKHWDDGFSEAFGEKKIFEVLLGEMEKLRDPNAHRRELHNYQKHLILGVSGELRTRIMKIRGKKDSPEGYFPVIEAVTDSLGNKASNTRYAQHIVAATPVRVGDEVEIQVFSTDPEGAPLHYSIARIGRKEWLSVNRKSIIFTDADIGRCCDINVMVKSDRPHHAYSDFDDYVMYRYIVLPVR